MWSGQIQEQRSTSSGLSVSAQAGERENSWVSLSEDLLHFEATLAKITGLLWELHENGADCQREVLDTSLHLTTKLHHTIADRREYLRIFSRQNSAAAKGGDFAAHISRAIQAYTDRAKRKGIHLSFRALPEATPFPFDAGKTYILLAKLLENALTHTPPEGRILIRLRVGREEAVVFVKEIGHGIEEHVFALDDAPAMAESEELEEIAELVNVLDARFQVRGKPGKFREISVVFPRRDSDHSKRDHPYLLVKPEKERANAPTGSGSESSKPDTILIVADDRAVHSYLRAMLEPTYRVVAAHSGKTGRQLAVDESIVLLICVSDLPDMDGLSMCRLIRQDENVCHLPFLLFSDIVATDFRAEGWRAGADGFLVPPLRRREVLARISSLVRHRRELRARFSRELVLQPTDVPVPSEQESFLTRFAAAIDARLSENRFGVLELADEMAMSPRALHRKLKRATKRGPGFWLRSFRVQRAAQLLRARAGSIGEISKAVGYIDVHHFARLFRQNFGLSPSRYAEELPHEEANNGVSSVARFTQ